MANVTNYNLAIGNVATAPGAVFQSGDALTLAQAAKVGDLQIGNVTGGYGYYQLSGGALNAQEVGVGGYADNTGSAGVMDISGGTFCHAGCITVGRGTALSSGVLNVFGGGVIQVAGTVGGSKIAMDAATTAGAICVINIFNGGLINCPANATYILDLAYGNGAGTLSAVNLGSGGMLAIGGIAPVNVNPTALLNFNGGTLKATIANAAFLTSANVDGVFIYPNGATIDDSGFAITGSVPLQAPGGHGVSSIAVTNGGSSYFAPPIVTFTGGGGSGAGANTPVLAANASGGIKMITPTVANRKVYLGAQYALNIYGFNTFLATPTISPNGASYTNSVTVTLADATPGATICYTLDGTTPTTNSLLYTAPFVVTTTLNVSAIAVKSGTANSAVATASFINTAALGNGTGLLGQYWSNTTAVVFSNVNFATATTLTRTDAVVNFNWSSTPPSAAVGQTNFAARWTGCVQPQFTENYTFTTVADAYAPNNPVSTVSFYANGSLLGTLSNSPYAPSYFLTATGLGAGSYALTAVATDGSGLVSTSAPVSITVAAASGQPYGLTTNGTFSAFGNMPTTSGGAMPALLSGSGAFASTPARTAAGGFIPYNPNTALWSDAAQKSRNLAVPNNGGIITPDKQIGFTTNHFWTFPAGTVFVKTLTSWWARRTRTSRCASSKRGCWCATSTAQFMASPTNGVRTTATPICLPQA